MESDNLKNNSVETVNRFTIKRLFLKTKEQLSDLLDISGDTDKEATIADVISGIPIKGQAAWVLVFSIFIASVGLNISSTAVVIGAMLISPLMGPILGIGMSLGINDIDLLKRALKNFGIMIFLSLLTSFLFFSIPMFQSETPELLARTSPDVRDVLIAFAGGLAMIVAQSRKVKLITTMSGVAIATALMPPLCTAGYGLATGKWDFFGGAMFLFTINTIFIALATFLVVRFLKFPVVQYLNSIARKRISQIISGIALLILVPSMYLFYQLYKKSDFEQKSMQMIQAYKIEHNLILLDSQVDFVKQKISFIIIGKTLTSRAIEELQNTMASKGYPNVEIDVLQDLENKETLTKLEKLESSYVNSQGLLTRKEDQIVAKDQQIFGLQQELQFYKDKEVPFEQLAKEIQVLYPKVVGLSYSQVLKTNFKEVDTIPTTFVKWEASVSSKQKQSDTQKIENWLQVKLHNDKLKVVEE